MTKLFKSLALVLAVSLPAFAQQTVTKKAVNRGNDVTEMTEDRSEDFERVYDAKLRLNNYSTAVDILGLNTEQTEDFLPIFDGYYEDSRKIEDRRIAYVKEYADEMAEDDTARDEENETADFIENLMELDIDRLTLKKNTFDRLEDVVTVEKALAFFAKEDMINDRAKRKLIMDMLPEMTIYVPVSVSYGRQMDDYNNWNKVNIDGRVGVDHNFTYNGLEKLLTAAEAMTAAEGIEVMDFQNKKTMIMDKAAMLKKNWKDLSHADRAREAFVATADVLKTIAMDDRFQPRTAWVNKLSETAKMIKPSVKLTDQSDTVYDFFATAEKIVNDLVDQANGK